MTMDRFQLLLVTLVQATFVLATFVHIRNISAVTDQILTKLFGPNILGVLLFSTKILFEQNAVPQIFGTLKSIGPKILLDP